jgi:methylmalonyl-CoA epimerase
MVHLEHIGIAVDDAAAVASLYQDLLGVLPYKTETVASQHVRTHFLNAGSAKLELLEATGDTGPIATYVEKRGEGLHHLAFQVDDIDETFARIESTNYRILGDEPTPGADGKRIFFLHPKDTHGVLVEFCGSAPLHPKPAFVDIGGRELATYTAGAEHLPPLVMLHGAAGCTTLETAPLMRRLETQFHVIAVDLQGHGSSPATDTPISFATFTDDLLELLDALELQETSLFGFSMGGNVALDVARRAPNRIRSVAAHGANVTWTDERAADMQARLDADTLAKKSDRLVQHLSAHHDDWDRLFRRMHDWVATLPEQTPDMQAMAEKVTVPTLISCVDRDGLFSLDETLTLHSLLPDARLEIFRGSHHALPLAPLDRVAPTLASWFTQDN